MHTIKQLNGHKRESRAPWSNLVVSCLDNLTK